MRLSTLLNIDFKIILPVGLRKTVDLEHERAHVLFIKISSKSNFEPPTTLMTNNTSSLSIFNASFPSVKKPTKHGFGLFATKDLPPSTVVQKFIGSIEFPESEYENIPVSERAHCLLHKNNDSKTWVWMVPESDAR